MIVNAQKLEAVLQKPLDQSVYYFFSTEEYLVRQAARRAVDSLCRESGEDATVIPGPVPDLDQVVMAAGTISFSAPAGWWSCPWCSRAAFPTRIWQLWAM